MRIDSRAVHRWGGSVVAVFLFVIATSGLALQAHLIASPPPSLAPQTPANSAAQPLPVGATDDAIQMMLATVLTAAQSAQPHSAVIAVRLRLQGPQPIGEVTVAAPGPLQLAFDARTGELTTPPPGISKVHDILLRVHRGDVIGQTGVWISIATGLVLIGLAITGTVVYVRMFKARAKINRRGLFWQ
jgi:uncharacterized iron-regulated membrane protein